MQIPLDQFEQVIDEKILKRGLSYYKKGLVRDLEEVSPNSFEAIVEGSEDYTVRLTIILEYMENNMGRNHYENACRFIRKIIKLGERQKANEVIETLRLRYPKRRALMEELDKV